MCTRVRILAILLVLASLTAAQDWRDIANGFVIPDEGYADQPYLVKTVDGNWLVVLTTGKGVEGEGGQHIISSISADKGRTWTKPADIEPADGPEASWVVPLKVPSGRVYVFYTYNKDNIRTVPGAAGATARRVDTLGVYAFKYSDDHGRTWSRERYEIPLHTVPFDRANNFGGATQFFWGVGKPLVDGGSVFTGFAKVGQWGLPGVLMRSRGFLVRSDNILTERDPARIRFDMLPDDDEGLRAPKGPIAEETNLTALADGTLYTVYRTIDGAICHAYSYDRGRTWTGPEYATYTPGGRIIKNPRAFSFVRKFSNGKFLLWYHNHGGAPAHLRDNWPYYNDRNPGWIAGGVERNGRIHWSQPEILLYAADPAVRMSYPDLLEDDGRFFITETQKSVARIHEIDRTLLDAVWTQAERREVARNGLAAAAWAPEASLAMPRLPASGFTLDFWFRVKGLESGQTLLDTRDASGKGIAVTTSAHHSLEFTIGDGRTTSRWESDPGTHDGTLAVDRWQHATVIVDGGPKLILFVVNGVLNDGGPVRQFGWGRYDASIADANGLVRAVLGRNLRGEIAAVRVWTRPLLVSEAVGNFRAGIPPVPNERRLNQHRVTQRRSPAQEPGAETQLIPSLVEGVASREDWETRRRPELLQLWMRILGRVEPRLEDARWFGDIRKARIVSREETAHYTRVHLELPIERDFYQPHLLLLPKVAAKGKRPAVICWTSTTPDWRMPEQWWGAWLAERGYVVLTSWSFIRNYRNGTSYAKGAADSVYERFGRWLPMGKMVHDARREAEYLRSLKDVDPARIGFIGFSLGAKAAVYVAAFAPEIHATVALDPHIAINGSTNWYAPWYLDWTRPWPEIDTPERTVLSLLNPDPQRPGFEHDHHELMALAAPRPFLLIGGSHREDSGGDSDDLQSWGYVNRAREVYRLLGAEDRLEFASTNDGHKANGPAIDAAWQRFFERWLAGR